MARLCKSCASHGRAMSPCIMAELKCGEACADNELMMLFLYLLGFLALFSLLALAKVSRSVRDGYEDDAGFHFCEEVSHSTRTARSGPERRPSSFS
jgi:hypothetical protein